MSNDKEQPKPFNVSCDGKGIIECPCHPGHFTIPQYRTYCVDATGRVFSHRRDEPVEMVMFTRKYNEDGHAYWFTHGVRDDGDTKGFRRHRAVIAAHKGFSPNPEQRFVNHINGIPGDDRLENLEWCTHQENMQHAYSTGLVANNTVEMESWNVVTGEKKVYASVNEFIRQTNMPTGTIRKRLATDNAQLYENNTMRYRFTRDEWSDTPQQYYIDRLKTSSIPTNRYDVETGVIETFPSRADAGAKYGVVDSHVAHLCKVKHMIPSSGAFFRNVGDEFPVVTKLQYDFWKALGFPTGTPGGLVLLNSTTMEEEFRGTYNETREWIDTTNTGAKLNGHNSVTNAAFKGKTYRRWTPIPITAKCTYLKDHKDGYRAAIMPVVDKTKVS